MGVKKGPNRSSLGLENEEFFVFLGFGGGEWQRGKEEFPDTDSWGILVNTGI